MKRPFHMTLLVLLTIPTYLVSTGAVNCIPEIAPGYKPDSGRGSVNGGRTIVPIAGTTDS